MDKPEKVLVTCDGCGKPTEVKKGRDAYDDAVEIYCSKECKEAHTLAS